jgi:DsbC/DsbD-like thiol-disulfide interchange protein
MHKLAWLFLLPLGAYRYDGAPLNTGVLSLRPVRWTLIGGTAPRDVVMGRTVRITVRAEIAKGWHIYSLTQKPGGPIPLRLELVGPADVLMRGVIDAPKPERTFDKNFGIETELYSGSPRFTIPVGVTGHSLTGIRRFQISARYQVCSDKVCLPPRTDKLDAALRITGRK